MTRLVSIKHDGGTHDVMTGTDSNGDAVIHFGASFTLRVDEQNLNRLRLLLHDTALDLVQQRSGGRA